jgi:hypothetical protein
MKKPNLSILAGMFVGAVFLACVSANAQLNPVSVTVDENGNATSTGNILTQGTMGVEEWASPAVQVNVLKYWFNNPPFSTDTPGGVVLIYDDAAQTKLSDVISFFPDGVQYLEFMSLDNNGDKADIASIPFDYTYLTQIKLTEGANGDTTYTPGSSDPGSLAYYGDSVTYTFESSDPKVPDGGSTACLMGSAMLVLGALRRKLN